MMPGMGTFEIAGHRVTRRKLWFHSAAGVLRHYLLFGHLHGLGRSRSSRGQCQSCIMYGMLTCIWEKGALYIYRAKWAFSLLEGASSFITVTTFIGVTSDSYILYFLNFVKYGE